MRQTLGVVDIVVAGETAKYRLPQKSGFSAFADLELLLGALDVTLLTYEGFVPDSLDGHCEGVGTLKLKEIALRRCICTSDNKVSIAS